MIFVLSRRTRGNHATVSAHEDENDAWLHALKLIPDNVKNEMGDGIALAKSWNYFTEGLEEFYVTEIPIIKKPRDLSALANLAHAHKITKAELEELLAHIVSDKFERMNLSFENQIEYLAENYSNPEEAIAGIVKNRNWLKVI